MSDTISAVTISLAGARKAIDAAVAAAEAMGARMCVAVVDNAGEAIATVRMDGAPRLSAGIALNKAYTVTGFLGVPTANWWGMIGEDPSLVHGITHTPRLTIFGGGVPVHIDGQLVGAVGASGGSAEQDAEIAAAGAAALAG